KGTEIVSIDGTSVQKILAKLMTVARADGSNDSKRIAQLAVTGDSEYETFDIYYPMFFAVRGKPMNLVVRLPGSLRQTQVAVAPLSFEQRIAPIKQREAQRKGGSDAQFESRQLADGGVYLKMPTWALYDSKWDWKGWLNETLNKAVEVQAPALILD